MKAAVGAAAGSAGGIAAILTVDPTSMSPASEQLAIVVFGIIMVISLIIVAIYLIRR